MTASIRRDVNFFPSQFEGEGWLFEQPKTHLVFYCFLCSGSCVSGQCFLYCSVIWVRGWMRIWELYLAFQRSKKNTASDFKNNAWARLQRSFNDERINVTGWTIKNKYLFIPMCEVIQWRAKYPIRTESTWELLPKKLVQSRWRYRLGLC